MKNQWLKNSHAKPREVFLETANFIYYLNPVQDAKEEYCHDPIWLDPNQNSAVKITTGNSAQNGLIIQANKSNQVGLQIQGSCSQTADLLQILDSAGTVKFRITAEGQVEFGENVFPSEASLLFKKIFEGKRKPIVCPITGVTHYID